MIRADFETVAEVLGATLEGGGTFEGVTIDSRQVAPGNLFVALLGERHDGHLFIREAMERGASGCLCQSPSPGAGACLQVSDTLGALQTLARWWRGRLTLSLVGVTGSNGKTTVKEMIASILKATSQGFLATQGNLNNHIGVPLTLLRAGEAHRYGVIEMGANAPGEIAALARDVRPKVGVITHIGAAHLKGFKDLKGVARAKGEMLRYLAPGGWAVFPAASPYASMWIEGMEQGWALTFGPGGEVVAEHVDIALEASRFTLCTPWGKREVGLPLPGRHNVMNALAAAACSLALGVSLDAVVQGLSTAPHVAGRLSIRRLKGGTWLIDDTYNANPSSLKAALDVLGSFSGKRMLAMGDMAELGSEAARWHWEAGRMAREQGVSRLWAVGEQSRLAVEAFGEGGRHFPSLEALVEALHGEELPSALLVKGSRCMAMEEVVCSLS